VGHTAHPAVGSTLTIGNAWDINNNGLILGAGRYDDGPGGLPDGERNFILDASSLMVPEPSGLAVLALAGSALLRRQQRGSRRK